MDARAEHQVLTRLREGLEERITVIVTHVLDNGREGDRVLGKRGRTREDGSFDELVRASGPFVELCGCRRTTAEPRGEGEHPSRCSPSPTVRRRRCRRMITSAVAAVTVAGPVRNSVRCR
ncbi:hypothetical protein [Streptomyces sp. NPDC094049]|uniref:hypothetical protein n=1 Tax=Streptomyces sp. NPDC094049 TaxID=3154987 RepID=UPI0033201EEE